MTPGRRRTEPPGNRLSALSAVSLLANRSLDGSEQYPDSSRSVESLREVRLLGLLPDVVGEQGKVKATAIWGSASAPQTYPLSQISQNRRPPPY